MTALQPGNQTGPKGGWIVLDKPLEMTSAKAVAIVRRIAGFKKAGHAGTLDPLATGILPIALGEATKAIPFLQDREKEYVFTLTFGVQTSTDDAEGEAVATSDVRPDPDAIAAIVPQFLGTIMQRPPIFSAIKVGGKRAYDLARAGDIEELPARQVKITDLSVLSVPSEDQVELRVTCGKGTYIRSLARDMALGLGTVGHVSSLRRTRVGAFSEACAISLANLEELGHIPRSLEGFYPTEYVLDDIPAIIVSDEEARHLRDGRSIQISGKQALALKAETIAVVDSEMIKGSEEASGFVGYAMNEETLVAIVEISAPSVKPKRVFNL